MEVLAKFADYVKNKMIHIKNQPVKLHLILDAELGSRDNIVVKIISEGTLDFESCEEALKHLNKLEGSYEQVRLQDQQTTNERSDIYFMQV